LRADVTAAANHADRLLRAAPKSVGESRDEGRRILFVDPLGFLFEVDEGDMIVRVLTVWRTR